MMNIILKAPKDNAEIQLLSKVHLDYISLIDRTNSTFGADQVNWDNLMIVSDDNSFPQEALFRWEYRGVDDKITFDLLLSTDANFDKPKIISNLDDNNVTLSNLLLDTCYYWKVLAKNMENIVAQSEVHRFKTSNIAPRFIKIPGITNVRDIGGWKTADGGRVVQNLIYRSSEMDVHLSITDVGKKMLIEELGIKTDLDLRGEVDTASIVLDEQLVQWLNIPIKPYGNISDENFKDKYRQIFSVFSDISNYPILVHCWGGADRAGTVIFLLNGLLGVSLDDLILDYELTTFSIWGLRTRQSTDFRALICELERFGAPDDTINTKIENYLLSIGVTKKEMEIIRSYLLQS